jgi:threonine/homoserine/homoserine lactone efflux protein
MEVILFIAISFAAGLSGAIVPGPMLTITISDSAKKGFITGPLVVLGHLLAEIGLIIFMMAGFSWLIGSNTATMIIGTLGGIMLVFMGYNTSKNTNNLLNDISNSGTSINRYRSVSKGLLTSISNPYFFIWWATIGWAFMFRGLEIAGFIGLIGFLMGHWSADLSWYSMVSFFSSKGSKIMTDNHFKIIMKICGAFLIILGFYFLINAQLHNLILYSYYL